MAKLSNSNCPNCGAAIKVDGHAAKITCEYCGQDAAIRRKTMMGRRVPQAQAAAAVIHVANPATPLIVALLVFGMIGGITSFVVCKVRKAVDRAVDQSTKPSRTAEKAMETVHQALSKIGQNVLSPLSVPEYTRVQFRSYFKGDVRAVRLILRANEAAVDRRESSQSALRHWYRNKAVTPGRTIKTASARTFSLARVRLSLVKKIKADATRRQSGGAVTQVEYGPRGSSFGWTVTVAAGNQLRSVQYDRRGRWVRSD